MSGGSWAVYWSPIGVAWTAQILRAIAVAVALRPAEAGLTCCAAQSVGGFGWCHERSVCCSPGGACGKPEPALAVQPG